MTPKVTECRAGYARKINSTKIRLALESSKVDIGKQLEHRARKSALARSGFADNTNALALPNGKVDPIDGAYDRPAHTQMYPKIANAEERRGFSIRGSHGWSPPN
jgi:hypothetical protein